MGLKPGSLGCAMFWRDVKPIALTFCGMCVYGGGGSFLNAFGIFANIVTKVISSEWFSWVAKLSKQTPHKQAIQEIV